MFLVTNFVSKNLNKAWSLVTKLEFITKTYKPNFNTQHTKKKPRATKHCNSHFGQKKKNKDTKNTNHRRNWAQLLPIKLNGDTNDFNPHRSRRLSVAVGDRRRSLLLSVTVDDWRRSWCLSVAVGDRRRAWRLSVTVGDRHQSERLSVAIGNRHRSRHLSVAIGDRHIWRRLSSSLAPMATLQLAVGVDRKANL